MLTFFKQFLRDEEGAAAIEYALIAALIAIAIVAGATTLGGNMGSFFSDLGGYLQTLGNSIP